MGVTSLDPRAFIPVARSAMLGMLKQSHREQLSHCSTTECQLPTKPISSQFFEGGTCALHQVLLTPAGSRKVQLIVHRKKSCVILSKLHEDAENSRQFQIEQLNQLYREGNPSTFGSSRSLSESRVGSTSAIAQYGGSLLTDERHIKTGLVESLPLCFVPWTLLPGSQELLHVYEPHHIHLFETILAQPRPWRYGHMLTSAGGCRQVIGIVAEVQEVERFKDGRMLLLVSAVTKMRVLRPSQKVPFVRATVEREQDEEESLVAALYPGLGTGLSRPSANKNGVRSSGPEWDPEVAAAAVMTHELRRRETELWDCYDQVRLLTAKLRMDGRVPRPPPNLLGVLPPHRSQVPGSFPRPRSVEQKWEDPAAVVSRVRTLSYAVGAALPDVKRAEGRQAFLEASSIRERMDLAAELMTNRRSELAARVAVKQALADTSTNRGS